jgi:hypothetical protein
MTRRSMRAATYAALLVSFVLVACGDAGPDDTETEQLSGKGVPAPPTGKRASGTHEGATETSPARSAPVQTPDTAPPQIESPPE